RDSFWPPSHGALLAPSYTSVPYTTLFRSPAGFDARGGGDVVQPQDRGRVGTDGVKDSLPGVDDPQAVVAPVGGAPAKNARPVFRDRKSTRLNSSHVKTSYAVFCLKKKRRA